MKQYKSGSNLAKLFTQCVIILIMEYHSLAVHGNNFAENDLSTKYRSFDSSKFKGSHKTTYLVLVTFTEFWSIEFLYFFNKNLAVLLTALAEMYAWFLGNPTPNWLRCLCMAPFKDNLYWVHFRQNILLFQILGVFSGKFLVFYWWILLYRGSRLTDITIRLSWMKAWKKGFMDKLVWAKRKSYGPDQNFLQRLVVFKFQHDIYFHMGCAK